MASGDRVDQRLAAAQAEQARAKLELALDRLARVEIVAPFDGVVVKGDLSQQLGSPVEQGKVLFELAPLDAWRVMLKVDERDIAAGAAGRRPGELVLTSLPGQALAVHASSGSRRCRWPRTAATTSASRPSWPRQRPRQLRPGMEGVAKVEVGERQPAVDLDPPLRRLGAADGLGIEAVSAATMTPQLPACRRAERPAERRAGLRPLVPRRRAAAAAARPCAHPPPCLPRRDLVRGRRPRGRQVPPLQPGSYRVIGLLDGQRSLQQVWDAPGRAHGRAHAQPGRAGARCSASCMRPTCSQCDVTPDVAELFERGGKQQRAASCCSASPTRCRCAFRCSTPTPAAAGWCAGCGPLAGLPGAAAVAGRGAAGAGAGAQPLAPS